jgi:hypothetical protein
MRRGKTRLDAKTSAAHPQTLLILLARSLSSYGGCIYWREVMSNALPALQQNAQVAADAFCRILSIRELELYESGLPSSSQNMVRVGAQYDRSGHVAHPETGAATQINTD